MANSVSVNTTNKDLWAGGAEPYKASYGKLMMWFFLISDAFTFSAFLIAYGVIRFRHPGYEGTLSDFSFSQTYWPVPEKVFEAFPFFHGVELPLVFVGLMTFILILSSVTMVLAVEAGHRMDRQGVEKWMVWTIFGGLVFLGCQAWEWSHFIHGTDAGSRLLDGSIIYGANLELNQYGPPDFAAFFFFITGFHGFHVIVGTIFLAVCLWRGKLGHFNKDHHFGFEAAAWYWHFVDVVWLFLFAAIYIWGS